MRAARLQAFRTGCARAALLAVLATHAVGQTGASEAGGSWQQDVAGFLDAHCVRCHGAERSKGDIRLHELVEPARTGDDLATWELVLEMLESGEMPPEDEPQPAAADRARVVAWLRRSLREAALQEAPGEAVATARRLSNFEYHNTMRDLLGIELDLTSKLPEDPTRPYRFNNTAEFLLMGLEHMDRYEDAARRAMASTIVDPTPPEVVRKRQVWGAEARGGMPDPAVMQPDEISPFGNRNRTVANGMQVDHAPQTGAFRIRLKASAILPPGVRELPLRIMLGYTIVGIGAGHTDPAEEVGTIRLSNSVDDPQVFELTGRLENFPYQPEHRYRRGGRIDGALVVIPPHFTVTPVNAYDDGTLNDHPDPLTMPRAVVEWMEFEAPVADVWPPKHHARILFPSPLRDTDPDAYVRAVLERFLPRAFRRPVSAAEVDRFVRIHEIVRQAEGMETLEASMRETLATALISPDFLYRSVTPEGGNVQHDIASRLSYFLWGSMPDDELFELAVAGELDRADVLEAQAERLLDDPRAEDFVEQFTTQWLGLHRLHAVPINLERFPRFLYTIDRGERRGAEVRNRPTVRDAMRAETVAFVHELITQNLSLLEVIDSDFALLNQRLARHYGVEGVHGDAIRRVDVSGHDHLGGVLTQGSILVGTGNGTAPHPVYRAVWLREAILGDEVPPPPADVPALEDSAGEAVAVAASLKEALALHRTKESCNDCHVRLDPWGIPFEEYDATGRFSPRVAPPGTRIPGFDARQGTDLAAYLDSVDRLATVVVEADARVPNGPVVHGVHELKDYLLRERRDDVAENVIRRLLTYALGRELTWRDRPTVDALLARSRQNDHRLRDVIVDICRTELFLGVPPR